MVSTLCMCVCVLPLQCRVSVSKLIVFYWTRYSDFLKFFLIILLMISLSDYCTAGKRDKSPCTLYRCLGDIFRLTGWSVTSPFRIQ